MLIRSASFVKSSFEPGAMPPPRMPEYAFAGRSNVGKSSLINLLAGNKNLAKSSSTPGKTRCVNHFIFNNKWMLADLPGYGYARAGKKEMEQWESLISTYLLERKNLCCVFVLVDARLDPQPIDLDMIRWLGKKEIPFAIVFTKADKLSVNHLKSCIYKYECVLLREWTELPPVFVSSAVSGDGRKEILDFIGSVNAGRSTRT